jgi:death-on-curing protein
LQSALGRVDNAIVYEGLDDVFEISEKYEAFIVKMYEISGFIKSA